MARRRHDTHPWKDRLSRGPGLQHHRYSGLPGQVLKAPYIAGGGITWSETWAFNTDKYPEGQQPTTMADIYDTEKFPWPPGLGLLPRIEMTFVLLSENPDLINTQEGRNSLSALNPEQVDRAFELFDGTGTRSPSGKFAPNSSSAAT